MLRNITLKIYLRRAGVDVWPMHDMLCEHSCCNKPQLTYFKELRELMEQE